jgi:hypothetical protein
VRRGQVGEQGLEIGLVHRPRGALRAVAELVDVQPARPEVHTEGVHGGRALGVADPQVGLRTTGLRVVVVHAASSRLPGLPDGPDPHLHRALPGAGSP